MTCGKLGYDLGIVVLDKRAGLEHDRHIDNGYPTGTDCSKFYSIPNANEERFASAPPKLISTVQCSERSRIDEFNNS